jgi:hypothetical protein
VFHKHILLFFFNFSLDFLFFFFSLVCLFFYICVFWGFFFFAFVFVCLFVCLFVFCLFIFLLDCLELHEQFFSYLVAVTIAGDMTANLHLCLALTSFSNEGPGSFRCQINWDMGLPFIRS